MPRTFLALLVTLIAAVLIGAFQIVGLDLDAIQQLLQSGNITETLRNWGAALFQNLIRPYTIATTYSAYAPMVALGVGGFVGGLVSKDPLRMLFVSIVSLVLFFLGYFILSLGAPLALEPLKNEVLDLAIDLAVSFALIFVPGIIGASMTQETDS